MNEMTVQKIMENLTSMFSQEWLHDIANQTGMIKEVVAQS